MEEEIKENARRHEGKGREGMSEGVRGRERGAAVT